MIKHIPGHFFSPLFEYLKTFAQQQWNRRSSSLTTSSMKNPARCRCRAALSSSPETPFRANTVLLLVPVTFNSSFVYVFTNSYLLIWTIKLKQIFTAFPHHQSSSVAYICCQISDGLCLTHSVTLIHWWGSSLILIQAFYWFITSCKVSSIRIICCENM